jgi:hypothetical protein
MSAAARGARPDIRVEDEEWSLRKSEKKMTPAYRWQFAELERTQLKLPLLYRG